MTSCCRANESEDLTFYRQLDTVARELATDPTRFQEDLNHPIKGDKLRRLYSNLKSILEAP